MAPIATGSIRGSATLGLTDDIRFVGQQDDVVPWLQALDLFVLPSYGEEGVPQAIMQAMACAIPVVSTPVGAIGEAVEHGITGLLVAPARPRRFSIGLAALRDDPPLRMRFAAAARERAELDFGHDRMLDPHGSGVSPRAGRTLTCAGSPVSSASARCLPRSSSESSARCVGAGPMPSTRCSWTADFKRTDDPHRTRCCTHAVDHRSAPDRRPADEQCRRRCLDFLQRRSL
jgi:hypothetical protein